jgi:hypothetical protein
MNGILGLRSGSKLDTWTSGVVGALERDSYSRVQTASFDALKLTPEIVVKSLVGDLMRVLRASEHLQAFER